MINISIVVPIFNERESICPLFESLLPVLAELKKTYEIIFVDDGSFDGSDDELRALVERNASVKVVELRHNFGQSAALSAGIQQASGDVIVTMDGDLQNDPTDIPLFLAKIDEGYDLVHGWRRARQDKLLSRRVPSVIANWLISWVTRFPVHDIGCTMKAIRREVAQEIHLYGEMHRFIPILARLRGARCVEIVARHQARRFGTSKYGISRTLRVLLDLLTVKFLVQYLRSPMRLFGSAGLICAAVSMTAGVGTLWMKIAQESDMTGNPLLLLSIFTTMAAVQFFGMGMLGELGARIYYESQSQFPYAIRNSINFAKPSGSSRLRIRAARLRSVA